MTQTALAVAHSTELVGPPLPPYAAMVLRTPEDCIAAAHADHFRAEKLAGLWQSLHRTFWLEVASVQL